jgi:hypothetical protein
LASEYVKGVRKSGTVTVEVIQNPMGSALRYWHWVRLNGSGQRQVEEIPVAKTFFCQQFPQFIDQNQDVSDAAIQQQLLDLRESQPLAELCLRCFISEQIDQACLDLVRQFGTVGGFKHTDLLHFVLDDYKLLKFSRSQPNSTYQSLADKILETFNPERAQLSTWVKRLVKSHEELRQFLFECGVHLVSPWSLLNNYYPQQLERLLTQRFNYNSITAKQAAEILDSYQTIYLSDRLKQNRFRSRCQPPSTEQLNRILDNLTEKKITGFTPESLLETLESLAEFIRQSRQPKQEPPPSENYPQPTSDEAEIEMQEFLRRYRQLLVTHLDQAISQVLRDRINYLRSRKKPKDQQFIQGLKLYCQSQPMKEIAQEIGLKQQYQVSRFLNLRTLREDVQQRLLVTLKMQVFQLAQYYIDRIKLEQLEQAVATEIDRILAEAEREASHPNCSRDSLFTRRLFRHL